ncbi:hypothetical protein [Azospirillum endophyticum]
MGGFIEALWRRGKAFVGALVEVDADGGLPERNATEYQPEKIRPRRHPAAAGVQEVTR